MVDVFELLTIHPAAAEERPKMNTRKPFCRKETARCRSYFFSLKFADNIHYKSRQASKARLQSSKRTGAKKVFNAKCPFEVVHGHVFWSQWKGDKGRSIITLALFIYLFRFQRRSAPKFSSTKDPQSFRGSQIFCRSRSAFAHLCGSRHSRDTKIF